MEGGAGLENGILVFQLVLLERLDSVVLVDPVLLFEIEERPGRDSNDEAASEVELSHIH